MEILVDVHEVALPLLDRIELGSRSGQLGGQTLDSRFKLSASPLFIPELPAQARRLGHIGRQPLPVGPLAVSLARPLTGRPLREAPASIDKDPERARLEGTSQENIRTRRN